MDDEKITVVLDRVAEGEEILENKIVVKPTLIHCKAKTFVIIYVMFKHF